MEAFSGRFSLTEGQIRLCFLSIQVATAFFLVRYLKKINKTAWRFCEFRRSMGVAAKFGDRLGFVLVFGIIADGLAIDTHDRWVPDSVFSRD